MMAAKWVVTWECTALLSTGRRKIPPRKTLHRRCERGAEAPAQLKLAGCGCCPAFTRIDASKVTPRLYQGDLGMWSDLLVACLISLPALIYGAVQ